MAKKGYWVVCYESVSNPDALVEYRKLAGAAVSVSGGHAIISNSPARVHEAGVDQRVVIIEFDSLEKAIAAYESDEYKKALVALGNAAKRDFRIVEGV
ncbi:MAG TPA: DUF1330 domain-containing protein [Candidatus Acidoferrum sp.]|nr:DUF1330 domain-containing protein [Candidatus Acidoferrum sp.]